jgi:intracellular multiplication protein IcmJ
MTYLRITPGIGQLSDTGRVLSPDLHKPPEALRTAVLERDDHTCRFCGFQAKKYQEVLFTGGQDQGKGKVRKLPDPKSVSAGDYVTACTLCHQCFHIEKIDRMQSGAIIWLPEVGQAMLHHICRAIYVARISQGPMADAARDSLEALLARKEEAVSRLGTDSPRLLATVLQDFLENNEYRQRAKKLKGFRILPLDRRIIREGDLEFNQFPQILAHWRSKDGPFGAAPPREWAKIFYDLKAAAA